MQEPGYRHVMPQPALIPAGGQGAHAQVDQQPHGKQHIAGVAVDQGGDEDKQHQHQDAALQQAGVVLEGLDGRLQRGLVPLQHAQARWADKVGAAQHRRAGLQALQPQAKAAARVKQPPLMAREVALAQWLQLGTAPAGQAHQMARGELDHRRAVRLRRRHGEVEPERGFLQLGIAQQHRLLCLERGQGSGGAKVGASVFEHTHGHRPGIIVGKVRRPGEQGPQRQHQHGPGQGIDEQPGQDVIQPTMQTAPEG